MHLGGGTSYGAHGGHFLVIENGFCSRRATARIFFLVRSFRIDWESRRRHIWDFDFGYKNLKLALVTFDVPAVRFTHAKVDREC